jgi:antirestriction protein ArdC
MKAQELVKEIEARLKDLGEQTAEARHSNAIAEYLAFVSQFHRYSFYNTLSIWFHCPEATRVAGYIKWKALGRHVKRGEKGIPILAPCPIKKKVEDETGEEKDAIVQTLFKVVYVFDVSQTEGDPLPEAPITPSGDSKGLLPAVEKLAKDRGIVLEYRAMAGSHHGTSFGGRIEIDGRLDEAGKVAVIIHELAHEELHHEAGEQGERLSSQTMEIEAEAVSFVVCTHFGIETAAPNYLALWKATPDKIIEAFNKIHTIAASMVESIEEIAGDKAVKGGDEQ